MKRKAFTLIELLVVIAIIAILAAILFPVFAQAKLSAKKAASLSNIKQVTLAGIMYEGDYDDNFALGAQDPWNGACGIPAFSGSIFCWSNYAAPTLNWPFLLQPYIKSMQMMVDPATGDPEGIWGSGVNALPAYQNTSAQYGYNAWFLSPIGITSQTGGGWVPTTSPLPTFNISRSSTTSIHPTLTPMFTGAQSGSLSTIDPTSNPPRCVGYPSCVYLNANQLRTPDNDVAVPPGESGRGFYATNRLVFVPNTSKSAAWMGAWVKTTPYTNANAPTGTITGTTRALGPYVGALVGFVDGHAKSMSDNQLAVGTDFGTSTTTSGHGYGADVTDDTKYVWSLDGTSNDIGNSVAYP